MKNSIVKYMKSVIVLLCITFIIPSTLTLNNREIATKLQIENNLEEKVINVISKIYDSNKFACRVSGDSLPHGKIVFICFFSFQQAAFLVFPILLLII